MYLKSYVMCVIIMLIIGYLAQRCVINRPKYRGYNVKREPPPRFWGPFSRGELIGWILRSVMLPFILPFAESGMIPDSVLKVVIAVHAVLWMILVPFIVQDIVDGKW